MSEKPTPDLHLETDDNADFFAPGTPLSGIASWVLPEAVDRVELRLFWYTEGKGDQDITVVEEVTFENPALQSAEVFRFTLPPGPLSYSGKILSVCWALELVTQPGQFTERLPFTLRHTAQAATHEN